MDAIKFTPEFRKALVDWMTKTLLDAKGNRFGIVKDKVKVGKKHLPVSMELVPSIDKNMTNFAFNIGAINIVSGTIDTNPEMPEYKNRETKMIHYAEVFNRSFIGFCEHMSSCYDIGEMEDEFTIDTFFGLRFSYKQEPDGYVAMISQDEGKGKVIWGKEEHSVAPLPWSHSPNHNYEIWVGMMDVMIDLFSRDEFEEFEIYHGWFN